VVPVDTSETYTTLTIATAPTTAALRRNGGPMLPAASLAAFLGCMGWKRRRRLVLCLLLLLGASALSVLSGCAVHYTPHGGGGNPVTVTGTSGALRHSATLSLTVD
jgi:hypothetical protein